MKKCKKCGIEKTFDCFGNNKNNQDGKSIYCFECERLRSVEYREKNRQKVNDASKKWRIQNPEKYKEVIVRYLEKNPDMSPKERIKKYRKDPDFVKKESIRRKMYYLNNIDKEREKRKEYYYNNKKQERLKNNEWKKNKLKTDPIERVKKNLRDRIREYLNGKNKSKRTFDIIGLDKENFKMYIQSKFEEGMSWENYGEWHIDHIKPLCLGKNEEDVLLLNHYTNLQPLWAKDNLIKNRKYDN
jgi:hypothetical protein